MKSLVVLACLALPVFAAHAQTPHYLDLFFTADPTNFGQIPVTDVPTPPAGPYPLDTGADTWLALWGKTSGQWQSFTTTYKVGPSTKTWVYTDWVGDVWQSVAVSFTDAAGVLVQADSYCDNPTAGAATPSLRWLSLSHFTWDSAGTKGGFYVATLSDRGLGGSGVDSTGHPTDYHGVFDGEQIADVPPTSLDTPGYLYSILGYAHIVDTSQAYPANLYFVVGAGTIGRRGGTPNSDYVRFGTSTQVLAKTVGAQGDQPLLQFIGLPTVISQPANQTACTGTAATFTVAAAGATPLTYQWRKDAAPIPGATGNPLTIDPVSAGDAGSYDVVVSNTLGAATSDAATLTVLPGVSISSPPAGAAVCPGASVTFTVDAAGTPPLSYQWRKNGQALPGATAASLTLESVGSGDAGAYDVVVSNTDCSVTSAAAVLTVNAAPAILASPTSQTRCVGTSATFSVTAVGVAPLSYQWRRDGVDIPGATAASHAIDPVGAGDAATYDVIVSDACGSATSGSATLTIAQPVSIISPPAGAAVCAGASVTLTVTADGAPPLQYQWRKNGAPLAGATGSSFTLGSAAPGDSGTYDCVVCDSCGTVTTSGAALTVTNEVISAPAGVDASKGTFADQVSVTWQPVAGATQYLVYRSATPAPCAGLPLGTITGSTYADRTAAPGTVYFYSVQAQRPCGNSPCSALASGFAGAAPDHTPTANAGPDQDVLDADNDGLESITLDASGSTVSAGTLTAYDWSELGVPLATGVQPTVTLPTGTHDIELTVTSDTGATASDSVTVTVHPCQGGACGGCAGACGSGVLGVIPLTLLGVCTLKRKHVGRVRRPDIP